MSGTRDAILDATRDALADHGYAGLSMSKVAANFDGSQSLIHHHFDGKEGLLAALVARERERVAREFAAFPDDPGPRLDALLEAVVGNLEAGGGDADDVAAVFTELAVAAREYDAVARELDDLEALVRDDVVDTIERGVQAGAFADVDARLVAELVLAANERAANARLLGYESDVTAALEALVLAEVRE